jgi:hypothetical protein
MKSGQQGGLYLPVCTGPGRAVHGRGRGGQEGDLQGLLRAALDRVAELAQLVEGFEWEPSEAELKEIGREPAGSKDRVLTLAQALVKSNDPAVAREAHEVAREAN